jgi:hypothetical protein
VHNPDVLKSHADVRL